MFLIVTIMTVVVVIFIIATTFATVICGPTDLSYFYFAFNLEDNCLNHCVKQLILLPQKISMDTLVSLVIFAISID